MPPGSASGTACEGRQYSLPGCDIAPTLVVALAGFGARSISAIPDKSPSGTSQVVRAAQALLATLTEQQRAKVLYKFDNNAQRITGPIFLREWCSARVFACNIYVKPSFRRCPPRPSK